MDERIQKKFEAIERGDVWGYDHQGRVAGTDKLRRQLLTFLDAENIGSIVDLPCGHFTWQSSLLIEARMQGLTIDYTGADIVPSIIQTNNNRADERFLVLDITTDDIPPCDLLIIRDCLVHLTDGQILAALTNILRAEVKWIAMTSFPDREHRVREDWEPLNYWRPLNMTTFDFPFPSWVIVEAMDPSGQYADKTLSIWKRSALLT
jgi:hypothetical protein